MKSVILAGILLLSAAMPLRAQEKQDAKQDALCKPYESVPLPAEAQNPAKPKIFPSCEAYKSYAGIGRPVDFAAARNCAWTERLAMNAYLHQNPDSPLSWVLGGSIILSELYANGEGVVKNLPLAIHLACEEGAKAERSAIEDLNARQDNPPATSKRFDYCDFAYSQFSMNFCAGYQNEIDDQHRDDMFRKVSADWSAEQKDAFRALVRTELKYSAEHGEKEINRDGSARDLYINGAIQGLRDSFLAAIQAFERGLNHVYQRNLTKAKANQEDELGVHSDGLRITERAWIQYRDAFIHFAALRYPKVSRDAWLALLTDDRVSVLKDTACEIANTDEPCDSDGPEEDGHTPHPLP